MADEYSLSDVLERMSESARTRSSADGADASC